MSLDPRFLKSSWTWIQVVFHRSWGVCVRGSYFRLRIRKDQAGFMSQVSESVK